MSASSSIFHFTENFDVQSFTASGAKVCVVAVIGQTRLTPFASKASMLNPVVDRDIFQGLESVLGGEVLENELECYYDSDTQVLYLHLLSHLDTPHLVHHCYRMATAGSHQDFYTYWQHNDCRLAKVLLLLFSVSHILLLVHPGSTFELSNIKVFRTLDSIRLKLQAPLCEMLQALPVSKDWTSTGRLCSPRVLFVFQTPTFPVAAEEDLSTAGSKSRSQKLSPIKRLQHNLEDQIYRILRKSRVITNISNNSLFAIPANQEFVYIHCRRNDPTDPVPFLLAQMRSSGGFEAPRSKSYLMTRPGSSSSSDRLRSPLQVPRQENSFKEFLWQHIEMAFTKGFDDNVGRNPVAARFELPSAAVWFEVSQHIYKFLFEATPEGRAQTALNTLQSLLDTDLRFSESRCSKVMPMAETAYQQDLPQFYITSVHLSKVAQAKRVFSQFARGPAYSKYLAQLEEACNVFWRAGRQQCEAYSLTGNLCTNQRHRALSDPVTMETADLPVMRHSSQLKTRAACNCGRQQADKEDPFDHRSANYDFYMTLEAGCCGTSTHIDMPVFRPSTCDAAATAAVFGNAAESVTVGQPQETVEPASVARMDLVAGMSALSLALSLGQSGGSDLCAEGHSPAASCHDPQLSQGHSQVTDIGTEALELKDDRDGKAREAAGDLEEAFAREANEEEENVQGGETNLGADQPQGGETNADVDRMQEDAEADGRREVKQDAVAAATYQHSTTEYLTCMTHSGSLLGLLPKFPSWALCCLDTADCYNPLQGLELPGFLPGSHFLLPWDIPLRSHRDRWPTLGETANKRGRNIRRIQKGPLETADSTVRAYIGLEYECPRGHRFFCSAPDKMIKVLGTCTVKDTAQRLLNTDMPLYAACHCRAGKGYVAQLMRAYVVTPDAPIRILLHPLVRPAPPPCPTFHTGASEPFELPPGGIWVLRFPHVYMGENGAYNMPPDPQNLHASILLKGFFNYHEVASDG